MRHDLERGGWSRGERQQWAAALKQLDRAIADLHSAADEGNQKEAQSAVKKVEAALDQLKSQDPDTAFKSVH
ncbi:MAG: hypothetical protein JO334_17165 [Verrucomicrobia bacterium]|nr:hypothetical protein [Verrucomicrobiota bacterium]